VRAEFQRKTPDFLDGFKWFFLSFCSYDKGSLVREMSASKKVKGRLLYYYPPASTSSDVATDGWIGWHNDSGFLTALTAAMYFDEATGERIANPDPKGGL
jgi:hypothetical protein